MNTAIHSAIQQALDLVEAGASADWVECALECLRYTCERNETFVVDDVWKLMRAWYPHVETRDFRAMGPVLVKGKNRGWCERTAESRHSEGEYRPENLRSCHGHWRPVWRSRIFQRSN